jgi:hypothetical protein
MGLSGPSILLGVLGMLVFPKSLLLPERVRWCDDAAAPVCARVHAVCVLKGGQSRRHIPRSPHLNPQQQHAGY